MFNQDFQIARLPAVQFAAGAIDKLPSLLLPYTGNILLVTGKAAFTDSPRWQTLTQALNAAGRTWHHVRISDEPSPEQIDALVKEHHGHQIGVIAAIGGGSVLDAAKAIAGLLTSGDSVLDYLEGVGKGLTYQGPALPWIAVPTTAGTGSEATKNAVLSSRGEDGYKKSFRDEQLVAQVALIDPELLDTCSQAQLAANGMDAFTQLLESWVSLGASPFTDALSSHAMAIFRDGFWPAYHNDEHASEGRAKMAYASMISGITLAQAGLGSVHGLAAPLGAFFPAPHGEVCGTLLAAATKANIEIMRRRDNQNPALVKYAEAGVLLSNRYVSSAEEAQDTLIEVLEDWQEKLQLPRLSAYGMTEADIDRVVKNARGNSMKTNPVQLTNGELAALLTSRL